MPRESAGTYYFHKGTYFYQLSLTVGSWIFNLDNQTWSESDLFLQDVALQEFMSTLTLADNAIFALKKNNIGKLGTFLTTQKGNLFIQTARIKLALDTPLMRYTLKQEVANVAHGNPSNPNAQIVDLSISLDNILFGYSVRVPLAEIGKRLSQPRWLMNITGNSFTFRFLFVTNFDIAVEGIVAEFNNDTSTRRVA